MGHGLDPQQLRNTMMMYMDYNYQQQQQQQQSPQLSIPASNLYNDDEMNSKASFSELLGCGDEGSGSIGERRLRFKAMPPSSLPLQPRSPFFSIPPGLSPTTLLDSPVLLNTSQALTSPTTGTFPLLPISFESRTDTSADVLKAGEPENSSFAFKPLLDSNPNSGMQPFGNLATFSYGNHQALKGTQDEARMWSSMFTKTKDLNAAELCQPPAACTALQDASLGVAPLQAVSLEQQQELQTSESQQQFPEINQNLEVPLHAIESRSQDGYNWRKYGQKHVKGSEYPRSYYKCTHPSCPTKKKVERSLDGQVTEIVYKGVHNHPKPQSTRRMGASRVAHEGSATAIKVEGGSSSWGSTQLGLLKVNDDSNYCQGWKTEYLERSSSASVVTELSDPSSTPPRQNSSHLESLGTPEHSSISASEDDDGRTQIEKFIEDEAIEDEPDSKRRRTEHSASDIIGATRTIREPRVVVQTTSDIDILDDGYRWRKYGQKVVKGNPNPRSYYKCTNAGCPVRKHVERASHDAKAVITTYEGKHNHDVPAPRSSSHSNAAVGNGQSGPVLQNSVASSSNGVPLSAPQTQVTASQFDKQPDLTSNYAQSNYMFGRNGNESLNCHDRNVGIPNQGTSLGAFDLDNRHGERQQITGSSSYSLHVNPANQGFSGTSFNTSAQSYFGQANERHAGLIRPKEEQKDNFYNDSPLH